MVLSNNLADLCRLCLRQLLYLDPGSSETDENFVLRTNSCYNASTLPHLTYMLNSLFNIDVLQQPAVFPKSICNLCYSAINHFQQLCFVAKECTYTLTQAYAKQNQQNEKSLVTTKKSDEKTPISSQAQPQLSDETETDNVKDEPEPNDDDETDDNDHESEEECRGDEQSKHETNLKKIQSIRQFHVSKQRKLLSCDQCGKQSYKLPYLEAHIRAVHEGNPKPFLCRTCGKSFTRYEQLRLHSKNAHSNGSRTSSDRNAEQELICWQCNRKYSTKNALGEHLKRHAQLKPHVCEHCGVAKVTRSELLTHLRIHNPDWEKFKCNQCPQLFRHKSAISRHVRVVHEGQRRFKCGYCQKRFGTQSSQRRHERLHTGELPHRCKMCSKCFSDSDRLTTHMRTHDRKLWPYSCAHCAKPCITRQNLASHEQRHSGKKPHICNICSRGFTTEHLLSQHKEMPCSDRSINRNCASLVKKTDESNQNSKDSNVK